MDTKTFKNTRTQIWKLLPETQGKSCHECRKEICHVAPQCCDPPQTGKFLKRILKEGKRMIFMTLPMAFDSWSSHLRNSVHLTKWQTIIWWNSKYYFNTWRQHLIVQSCQHWWEYPGNYFEFFIMGSNILDDFDFFPSLDLPTIKTTHHPTVFSLKGHLWKRCEKVVFFNAWKNSLCQSYIKMSLTLSRCYFHHHMIGLLIFTM